MSTPKRLTRPLRAALTLGAGVALVATTTGASPVTTTETGGDLTQGSVFAMSNAREGNVVLAYARAADGTLTEVGRYDTGGTGSGSFEDTANGLVLGTSQGEAAPNNLIELAGDDQQLLFATNAGSNTVSVFQVRRHGLELVDVQQSGRRGEKPVSVTVNNGLVYVLNSGETNDDLFDADGNVIENCTAGKRAEITGFTVTEGGQLEPIRGSTRRLSNERISGCAQVSFDPQGDTLVVTERFSQPRRLDQQTSDNERLDDEGVIDTFQIRSSGRPGRSRTIDATGQGPFGFTFAKNGTLLTTEQFDGPAGPGRGGATSYVQGDRGELLRSSPSIQNGGTDTCWIVATDDQTLAFATSFFGDGRISSYELDEVGLVRLIDPVATTDGADSSADGVEMGASDLALSGDSSYLYQNNSVNGTINVFANNGDGSLSKVETVSSFPQPAFGPGMGMAAPIGLVAN